MPRTSANTSSIRLAAGTCAMWPTTKWSACSQLPRRLPAPSPGPPGAPMKVESAGATKPESNGKTIAARAPRPDKPRAKVEALNFFYGAHHTLKDINMPIADRRVTALIGPSGCGKSTFLRCFNRMHDLQEGTRYEGAIILNPEQINLIG